jgi:hypothetical protein
VQFALEKWHQNVVSVRMLCDKRMLAPRHCAIKSTPRSGSASGFQDPFATSRLARFARRRMWRSHGKASPSRLHAVATRVEARKRLELAKCEGPCPVEVDDANVSAGFGIKIAEKATQAIHLRTAALRTIPISKSKQSGRVRIGS